jgi:hypothetical protein
MQVPVAEPEQAVEFAAGYRRSPVEHHHRRVGPGFAVGDGPDPVSSPVEQLRRLGPPPDGALGQGGGADLELQKVGDPGRPGLQRSAVPVREQRGHEVRARVRKLLGRQLGQGQPPATVAG